METLRLNGRRLPVSSSPVTPLLDVLRDEVGDISPKPGCREGRCGACTVLLDGEPVLSCLVPLARALDGEVMTVSRDPGEGAGPLPTIQAAFARAGAVQCGICTPGMIMATHALLEEHPRATQEQIREALANNLCRCTGYQKIIEVVETLVGTEAAQSDG